MCTIAYVYMIGPHHHSHTPAHTSHVHTHTLTHREQASLTCVLGVTLYTNVRRNHTQHTHPRVARGRSKQTQSLSDGCAVSLGRCCHFHGSHHIGFPPPALRCTYTHTTHPNHAKNHPPCQAGRLAACCAWDPERVPGVWRLP